MYPDVEEEIAKDIPEPLGPTTKLTILVDADHGRD